MAILQEELTNPPPHKRLKNPCPQYNQWDAVTLSALPEGAVFTAVPLSYNSASRVMPSSRHALVTYVRNPVGEFVEKLRRELHPAMPHMPAHLTILPPRELCGNESAAVEFLEEACNHVVPFDVELGDVETFLPTTPTVFIQVARAAYRMRELHDQLSGRELCCEENWPYIPHLTIVKTELDEEARAATILARERWRQFEGKREVHVDELMFVRESNGIWQDVAPLHLGRGQLSSRP
jgi:2'-5' RNA ligase